MRLWNYIHVVVLAAPAFASVRHTVYRLHPMWNVKRTAGGAQVEVVKII